MPWPVSGARDCGLAMQAFSPQLRLLLVWLTKGVEQCQAFPLLVVLVFTFLCLFFSPFCAYTVKNFTLIFFFFFLSTRQQLAFAAVLLCFRNVLIRTLKAFKSPSVPTYKKKNAQWQICWGSFLPRSIYLQTEMQRKCSNIHSLVHPWAGNENYWLKAFQLRSQIRARITLIITFSRFFRSLQR